MRLTNLEVNAALQFANMGPTNAGTLCIDIQHNANQLNQPQYYTPFKRVNTTSELRHR